MKSMIIALMFISNLSYAEDKCDFYGEYAELFFNEKVNDVPEEQAITSLLYLMKGSEDYSIMSDSEKLAYDTLIKDLGRQVYFDDSANVEDVKNKSVKYCQYHSKVSFESQIQRYKYCQKKGNNAETITLALSSGLSREEIIDTAKAGLGDIVKTPEYYKFVDMISEIKENLKTNPESSPSDVGESFYQSCVFERG